MEEIVECLCSWESEDLCLACMFEFFAYIVESMQMESDE